MIIQPRRHCSMTAADQRNSRSNVDISAKLKPHLGNNNIGSPEAKVDDSIDRLREELIAHKDEGKSGDNGFVLTCNRTNADATHPLLPSVKVDRSAYDRVKAVEEGRRVECREKTMASGLPSPPRLVSKDGWCLVRPIHQLNYHYYRNWFHLLIEQSWRHILIIFTLGFVFSWLFFGLLYYLIVYMSGDLENPPSYEHHFCIANVQTFTSAFLFSLESQHTIGYGSRYMTEMCPPAFTILCFQLVIGVLLQTMLAGIVIAKVLRPKKRKQEMRFSQNACIGPMEGENASALMIRIADVQHRLYLAESHVRLYMAITRTNKKGVKELVGLRDMNVGYDSGTDRVLLLWPVVVRHVIDEDSPLYGVTPASMQESEFELIMTIEGIVEATGMTFQARTSFLPHEIKWAHKFVSIVTLDANGRWNVDYDLYEESEYCPEFSLTFFTPRLDGGEESSEVLSPGHLYHPHRMQRHTIDSVGEDVVEVEDVSLRMETKRNSLLVRQCINHSGFT